MTGLKIRTVTGAEFEVHGAVTCKDFPKDGRVYYCNGESWPESIVKEIMSDNAADPRIDLVKMAESILFAGMPRR